MNTVLLVSLSILALAAALFLLGLGGTIASTTRGLNPLGAALAGLLKDLSLESHARHKTETHLRQARSSLAYARIDLATSLGRLADAEAEAIRAVGDEGDGDIGGRDGDDDGGGGDWDGECSPGSPCPTPLTCEEIGCPDRTRATTGELTLRDSILLRGSRDGVVH